MIIPISYEKLSDRHQIVSWVSFQFGVEFSRTTQPVQRVLRE